MSSNNGAAVYEAWLASACMPGDLTQSLLSTFKDAERFYYAFSKNEEDSRNKIPPRFIRLLETNGSNEKLRFFEQAMNKHGIGVIRYDDPRYPETLKRIPDPPAILFYQGEAACLRQRSLGMVGSRAASYNGQKAARKLAADLSRYGVSIISGMACGIDAASHMGCLEGGSPTVAVTACGLDSVYPRDNEGLRDRILKEGGIILSEYAPGERPLGWHFPVRNRIITGLSRALILMESRIRSGSMTSVQHALDQGKDVFVYPGDPGSEQFEGNHRLLREGGIYFTSATDILEDLGWLDNPPSVGQNSDCAVKTESASPAEAAVLNALKPGTLSFEQLLDATGMLPGEMMSTLTILQISGRIEALPGKQYQMKQ